MRIKIQVKNQFDCSYNFLERHTTNYEKHILRDMRNAFCRNTGERAGGSKFGWLVGKLW